MQTKCGWEGCTQSVVGKDVQRRVLIKCQQRANKSRLLQDLNHLLSREIEDGEKGIQLPSYLPLHPSHLLQDFMRTLQPHGFFQFV